ncbi:hypothetical protein AL051_26470 [Pseudomonas amygdali pv. dendropanacis]|nr:hypothetical protein AL051_26470 [Pseudomonas amygdali pv. dendropanacis]
MSAFSSAATGRYHKVPLKNVRVWEPCSEADATEWLPPLDGATSPSKGYPIRPKRLLDPSLNRLHVIVQPDGALWPEGSFYLFWCKAVNGKHQSTISNIAGDLADMMNRLLGGCRQNQVSCLSFAYTALHHA